MTKLREVLDKYDRNSKSEPLTVYDIEVLAGAAAKLDRIERIMNKNSLTNDEKFHDVEFILSQEG